MKKTILLILILWTSSLFAEKMCKVKVCNKIERFTLSISSYVSDHLGETCYEITIPESEAVPGRILDSKHTMATDYLRGKSLNPTKKSVTRIKSVSSCSGK